MNANYVADTSFKEPESMAECLIAIQACRQQLSEVGDAISRARELGMPRRTLHGQRLNTQDELRKLEAWKKREDERQKVERQTKAADCAKEAERLRAEKEARRQDFQARQEAGLARRRELERLGVNACFDQISQAVSVLSEIIQGQAGEIVRLREQAATHTEGVTP